MCNDHVPVCLEEMRDSSEYAVAASNKQGHQSLVYYCQRHKRFAQSLPKPFAELHTAFSSKMGTFGQRGQQQIVFRDI